MLTFHRCWQIWSAPVDKFCGVAKPRGWPRPMTCAEPPDDISDIFMLRLGIPFPKVPWPRMNGNRLYILLQKRAIMNGENCFLLYLKSFWHYFFYFFDKRVMNLMPFMSINRGKNKLLRKIQHLQTLQCFLTPMKYWIQLGKVWTYTAKCGQVRTNKAKYSQFRSSTGRYGQVWPYMAKYG